MTSTSRRGIFQMCRQLFSQNRVKVFLVIVFGLLAACATYKFPPFDGEYKIASTDFEVNQDYPFHVIIEAGPDVPFKLQEALLTLKPGTIIELPEGTYLFDHELIINTSHVTLRGQGQDKTILSFKNTPDGAEGVLVLSDAFVIENIAIEDTAGDGIRVEGADGVIFRNIRVEWTGGPDPTNGSYGVYPVLSRNILIENSIVKGASDSGVYVGQSNHAVVRNNFVAENVAGIEIENTKYADVYNNEAVDNTAGVLVFDHPGLSQMGGESRIYNNFIHRNNTINFAPGGFLIDFVPEGTGIIVLATDDVEIFDNVIIQNDTMGLFLFSHDGAVNFAGGTLPDDFDSISERVNVHNNIMQKTPGRRFGKDETSTLIHLLFLLSKFSGVTDVVFDGFHAGDPADSYHCFRDNTHYDDENALSYGDIGINIKAGLIGLLDYPGTPAKLGFQPHHDCTLPPINEAVLDFSIFDEVPDAGDQYTEEEVAALCAGGDPDDVNWEAFVVDCPLLSDYRLFDNAGDPRGAANTTRALPYDLTTPLFTDYAEKDRYVFIPSGEQVTYQVDAPFDFPVGSIIVKTFTLPLASGQDYVVETRLMIKRESGFRTTPYVWDAAQTDAELTLGGALFSDLEVRKPNGDTVTVNYRVPNTSQCISCHGVNGDALPIGPKARLLNKDANYGGAVANQLTQWRDAGLLNMTDVEFADAPQLAVWDDEANATLEQRAMAYLETNCLHCHGEGGRAYATGLILKADAPLDTRYGLCKRPIAAGVGSGSHTFDIMPGSAADSIVSFRMASNEPAIRMPELGRSVVHEEGLALVNEWIDSLSGNCE